MTLEHLLLLVLLLISYTTYCNEVIYRSIFRLTEHKAATLAAFQDDFRTPVVISSLIDLIHYMNAQFDKVTRL